MSGGHWNYLSMKLEEAGESAERAGLAMKMLGTFEHELDWGYSGDSCPKCAELRVMAALSVYFDGGGYGVGPAIAVARDRLQNVCPEDAERRAKS